MIDGEEVSKQIVRTISRGITLASTRSNKVERVIHASSLYNFCLRKYVLAYRNDIVVNAESSVPLSLKVTFKLGQKIESMVLEALRPYLVGTLTKCQTCGRYSYKAPLFTKKIGKFRITGHPDAIITLDGVTYILEIKSIDKDRFKELTEPTMQNAWQLMTYLYLCDKPSYSDTGFVVYISKGHNNSPIKVYAVRQDEPFKAYTEARMEELKTFAKTNELPEQICNNKMFPLARECPVVDICFKRWII